MKASACLPRGRCWRMSRQCVRRARPAGNVNHEPWALLRTTQQCQSRRCHWQVGLAMCILRNAPC